MKYRFTIEWKVDDGRLRSGVLRGGDALYTHKVFDDWFKSCSVVYDRETGILLVEGWGKKDPTNPQETGMDPEMWLACEACFLRENIHRYCFSRAKGKRYNKKLHWCCRCWNGREWTGDRNNPLWRTHGTVAADSARSGVHAMYLKVIVEAVNIKTGEKHSKAWSGFRANVIGRRKLEDDLATAFDALGDQPSDPALAGVKRDIEVSAIIVPNGCDLESVGLTTYVADSKGVRDIQRLVLGVLRSQRPQD